MLDFALALVDHGERLDLALAGGFGNEFRHGPLVAVCFGLHAGFLLYRAFRRLTRQHQTVMLGDKAALAVQQAELAALAQLAHHRDRRVRHVSVERCAEEGEAAGDRRLHVGAEAQRSPRHLGHAGEAAVQLDRIEFPAVAADEIHHRFQHGVLRVAFIKLVAQQIVARLFRRGAAGRIDQAVFGNAGRARFRQRGQQHRAAHVHGRIGHHPFGVGPRDQAVLRRRRRDFLRRQSLLHP